MRSLRLPGPLHAANEGLAFLLELLALIALAWWGFSTGGNVLVHIVLGLGVPGAAAAAWGMFASPRARFKVPLTAVLAIKALVFGAAAIAGYALGEHSLAIVMAVVAALNTGLAAADRAAAMHARRT